MRKLTIFFSVATTLFMISCGKDDGPGAGPVLAPAKGIYVLSEGSFGANNTKLGYYNLETGTYTGDYFAQQNPGVPGLGDTGNDMIIYGGKLYIVMNVTSQVTVLNASTGALLSRIDFRNGTTPKSPRYATAGRGRVFVTAYDNTVSVIDTSALTIVSTINVGANPDGLAISGNYLYVANSGSFNFPDVDSTVSVVDLTTLAEIRKVTVGKNPNKVEVASNGDVYVSAYGNFSTIPASISVIDPTTNTLKTTFGPGFAYSHLRISGNLAYFHNNYGGTGTAKVYNTSTGSVVRNEFVTDGTDIDTPYGINIDDQNGDVYVSDAKDFVTAGTVTCFNKEGVRKFFFSVSPGVNPNKVVFNR